MLASTTLPAMVIVALAFDTEGNLFGLHSMK